MAPLRGHTVVSCLQGEVPPGFCTNSLTWNGSLGAEGQLGLGFRVYGFRLGLGFRVLWKRNFHGLGRGRFGVRLEAGL